LGTNVVGQPRLTGAVGNNSGTSSKPQSPAVSRWKQAIQQVRLFRGNDTIGVLPVLEVFEMSKTALEVPSYLF
jgi:hypothetical protein